jgi:hypothetical protein
MFPLARRFPLAACALGAALALTFTSRAFAQGCVVAHGSGMTAPITDADPASPWSVSVAYRWFQSDRHYVGTEEQRQRQAEGSQVINRSHFVDAALEYAVSPRSSLLLTVPYVSHDRSSVVRDNNRVILERYHTQASGIGDLQFGGTAWIWDPASARRGNVEVGLGLVLPTGKDDVRDIFEVYDAKTKQIVAANRTVDQSIQPGSGGYGINFNTYAYRTLAGGFTLFGNGSYTATPQNKNNVPTYRSNPFEAVMSIPDTYLARAGVEYAVPALRGFSLSLGGRIEGVMVRDLIGDSTGFRRPGYSIAVEPGIGYARRTWSARLYVPFAVQRNRLQSVPDKFQSAATGVYSQGDAAFADYLIMLSWTSQW